MAKSRKHKKKPPPTSLPVPTRAQRSSRTQTATARNNVPGTSSFQAVFTEATTIPAAVQSAISMPPPNDDADCEWEKEDLDILISFLRNTREKSSDGGKFRVAHLGPVVNILNQREGRKGGLKTPKKVKDKYARDFVKVFKVIQTIKSNSGWGSWDVEKGANVPINPTDSRAITWKEWVDKQDPIAKRFRNKGWDYYDDMCTIMGCTPASGSHVFRPSQQAETQSTASPSDNSEDDMDDEQAEGNGQNEPTSRNDSPHSQLLPPPPKQTSAPSKSPEGSTHSSNKRPTGPEAISKMSDMFARMTDTLLTVMAPPIQLPPSPMRRMSAI
ncbi:hypothetical protein DL96DRAFT_1710914 [Flagelloscypha sp. PMI_526]|nr:hypothetical protein DL96DRAFT_1556796 [Flagelloscypha sp. PMI_526]KAH8826327.1 hypothetical protein DL96DRAFT_1710914 [Flagelloscypha sp. PMI_526]